MPFSQVRNRNSRFLSTSYVIVYVLAFGAIIGVLDYQTLYRTGDDHFIPTFVNPWTHDLLNALSLYSSTMLIPATILLWGLAGCIAGFIIYLLGVLGSSP
ncbi:MAG TPA: hypothetical protein VF172_07895 [Nitrososphaera sp.]|jgi:hypothetical protein